MIKRQSNDSRVSPRESGTIGGAVPAIRLRAIWSGLQPIPVVDPEDGRWYVQLSAPQYSHSGAWKLMDYLITNISPTGRTTKSGRT